MKHLKTIMIIAVLLMIVGFCVCMVFGMWCMYDEGMRENQRQEVRVEEMEGYRERMQKIAG